MPHLLKNKHLEITVDFPDEGYKAARFDYTGKITAVKFRGILVTTTEQLNATNKDYLGKGFYNEFGIDAALGYHETAKGDWFHKIGVGLLKKDDDAYQFNKNYETKPANFITQCSERSISVICKSEAVNGYGYVLKKTILLHETGFTIQYFLENTGTKSIETTEYNHNFIAIKKELMGSSYELRFPFELHPEKFEEYVNSENSAKFNARSLFFNGSPKEQFFFSNMNGKINELATWELLNHQHKIGISETGSFNTKKVNLWGWKHVISPELFIEICLKPNEVAEWSRSYKFFTIS